MRSTQTQVLSFLATLSLLPQQSNAQAVYGMSVTPIAAYDSRWNGIAEGAVGSNGYMRDINGAPVLTSIWETSYDTIWSQAGVDVFFEAEQHLDLNNYSGTVPNPINILNFQSGQGGEETIYFNQANAGFEAAVAGFGSTTGSAKTHLTLFSNSYSNATPLNPGSPPDKPLDGGLTGFSASGLAATPNPGTVNPMRSIMATGDGVTAANEGGFNSPSGLPTTLAHELGHNGSLPHINGTRPSDVASEHYDPARSESLMFTGAGTGTQNVLNAGEVADALRTLEVNETLALKAGQTGTFWDSNGTTAGYGGAGTWDGTAANFGRPSGTGTSGAWVGNQVAVFRASGNYAVTVSGTQTATGIAVNREIRPLEERARST